MGHARLGGLPQTQKWGQVVALISGNADLEQVAGASADAAEHGLNVAARDETLVHAFWLLTQLPLAARRSDFLQRLKDLGLEVSGGGSLMEIVGAFTKAVDSHAQRLGRRSDLGEMAQHAAAQTLTSLVGRELPGLFGATPQDVQRALGSLGNSDRFSILARDFFSRLTYRSLAYFLSRELSKHVGPEKRFTSMQEHSRFNAALDLHCREASRIIKEFSSQWHGKTLYQNAEISREKAGGFAHVAFKKLRAELRRRRSA